MWTDVIAAGSVVDLVWRADRARIGVSPPIA
jgi:hypothetical protein